MLTLVKEMLIGLYAYPIDDSMTKRKKISHNAYHTKEIVYDLIRFRMLAQ